ncbi:MAG: phosphoribosylamine--glycine ligase [Rhodothermales bacterium]
MRILIVGSGGREHALAHRLASEGNEVVCAPGNAGTALVAENVAVNADDVTGLMRFVEQQRIDLTVVGPEAPLVLGIADAFQESGHPIVGPSASAARLEGSKAFAKAFMARHEIPTARFSGFRRGELNDAIAYVRSEGAPIVIKASGLAAGKGAVVCLDLASAESTLREMLDGESFGTASDEVVVESFMEGEEASVFVLCDGVDYVMLPGAQDHKRIGDGDVGPNTGGMGAYSPAPVLTNSVLQRVRDTIIEPTLSGMVEEETPYAGFLYVGLMIDAGGNPRVVEYNCRLGDPETQVIIPRIRSRLTDLLTACAEHRLGGITAELDDRSAAVVVVASNGYPASYRKGYPISGLDDVGGVATVYHAGTAESDGRVVTNGGRVLGITGLGQTLQEALSHAYDGVARIAFEGMTFRRDIGRKGLARSIS